MEINNKISDFYCDNNTVQQENDIKFSTKEFRKTQENEISNSKNYVKVVFNKPDGLFSKIIGKQIFYIRKGRKFGSIPSPIVKKFRKTFTGWMYKNEILSDTFIVNEPLILTPIFN